MTGKSSQFLEEVVALLVKEFGVDRVRAALQAASDEGVGSVGSRSPQPTRTSSRQVAPGVAAALQQLRERDREKHSLLVTFYAQLQERAVLPEPQDIRQFAQVVGLKDITGKSRRDLLPKLMRFLVEQPTERLRLNLEAADHISERQRKEGFSVLTDRLLAETDKGSGR